MISFSGISKSQPTAEVRSDLMPSCVWECEREDEGLNLICAGCLVWRDLAIFAFPLRFTIAFNELLNFTSAAVSKNEFKSLSIRASGIEKHTTAECVPDCVRACGLHL